MTSSFNRSHKGLLIAGASAFAIVFGAGVALAQVPVFNGTTGSAPTQSVVNGTSMTTTTGSKSVAPYTAVTTTVQNQTVNSTTAPTTTAITGTTPDGIAYTGAVTVSGTGSQGQTSTTTLTDVYNPGPPPTLITSTPGGPTVAAVGDATITAVSANGSVGAMATPTFGAVLSTSGTPVNGVVTATETDVSQSSAGTTYSTFVGTATYAPTTGLVSVALPSTPASSTSIDSAGMTVSDSSGNAASIGPAAVIVSDGSGNTSTLTSTSLTTGTVTAKTIDATTLNATTLNTGTLNANVGGAAGAVGINAGNGRISNLANGINPGDAVNLAQLQGGLNHLSSVAAGGTAVAAAMSGNIFVPGKRFGFNVNFATYLGQGAFAANVGYLVTPNIAINAGVASGFQYGGTAGRFGGTVGF